MIGFAEIWLVAFLVNCLLIIIKLLYIKETKITLSFWVRIMSLNVLSGVILMFLKSGISWNISDFIALLIPLYITYVVFMFRYEIKNSVFVWFNGIYFRTINAEKLDEIIFYKNKKNMIKKVSFRCSGKEKILRNDLGVEHLIIKFAKKNNIRIILEQT